MNEVTEDENQRFFINEDIVLDDLFSEGIPLIETIML